MSQALTVRQAETLITALRTGQNLDEAVTTLRLDLAAVWSTARTHTRLAVALAGRDPDTDIERARAARGDFLRLLALGLPAARAELAVGGNIGTWRGDDPAYSRACVAASEAAASYASRDQGRMTPQVTRRFLDRLRTPGTTVRTAAAAAGVTNTAIYQRRRRDPGFADAMKAAQAEARGAANA
ncbi:hypothetical protein [Streptomyces pseudovenezuelae]|uniref:hypothetical protein n=1 Tax=Streptomyces pseudovenezuelae TaxID=67350 RepID=UPI0036E42FD3